jgi:hypothetical protein
MAAKKNLFVPLHSIIVARPVDPKKPDGEMKQVDALAEHKTTGKAFEFTDAELADIGATNGGSTEMSLRAPTDEAPVAETKVAPAASNAPAPSGKDADL